jgi:hypothetical protein
MFYFLQKYNFFQNNFLSDKYLTSYIPAAQRNACTALWKVSLIYIRV